MSDQPTSLDEDQQLRRAADAAELLAHPLLRESFDTMRERISSELFASPVRDKEGREQLWLMRRLLDAVEGNLQTLVKTGELIQLERERKRSMLEKAKDWVTGVLD